MRLENAYLKFKIHYEKRKHDYPYLDDDKNYFLAGAAFLYADILRLSYMSDNEALEELEEIKKELEENGFIVELEENDLH